jgi:16S rRNA G527 N7-methylase RsmG
VPCLIARKDISARLIESKVKKCRFLAEAAKLLGLNERVEIVNRQFEETDPGDAEIATCRALDKFIIRIPKLLKWAKGRKLILFGGPSLEKRLQELEISYVPKHRTSSAPPQDRLEQIPKAAFSLLLPRSDPADVQVQVNPPNE